MCALLVPAKQQLAQGESLHGPSKTFTAIGYLRKHAAIGNNPE
jgi:hypothetical protein